MTNKSREDGVGSRARHARRGRVGPRVAAGAAAPHPVERAVRRQTDRPPVRSLRLLVHVLRRVRRRVRRLVMRALLRGRVLVLVQVLRARASRHDGGEATAVRQAPQLVQLVQQERQVKLVPLDRQAQQVSLRLLLVEKLLVAEF